MRRRFNFRFAAGLLAAGAAAAVGLAALHRRQVARQFADLPRLAERAEADGKVDRAERFLNIYLARAGGDQGVRQRLAELLARRADSPYQVRRVMAEYEKILAADPTRTDLRRRVADLYFRQRLYKESLGHAAALVAAAPADPAALDAQGRCEALLGDHKAAAATYARAAAAPAAPFEVFTKYASSLLKLNRAADADAAIETMVARYPKAHDVYLRRAAYLMQRQQGAVPPVDHAARVKADFAEAVRLAPDDADVLLLSAGLAEETGDAAAARRHLDRGTALHPADPRFHAALARRELADGRRAEAFAILKAGAAKHTDHAETTLALAELFLQLGGPDEAKDLLKALGARPGPLEALRVKLIEARIAMAEKRWATAFRGLEQVRGQIADTSRRSAEIDLDLAQCAANLRLTEQRLAFARRADRVLPDDPTVRYTLALAQVAANRPDEAEESYRSLAARPNIAPGILAEYARVLLALQRRNGPTPQRWDAVQRLVDRLLALPKPGPDVALLRAEVLLARGDPAGAKAVLTAARTAAPKETVLWIGLAALEAPTGGAAAAGKILAEAEAQIGDGPELRFARLRFAFDPADRSALDRLAAGTEAFPAGPRMNLLLQLTDANARTGRADVARRLLAEAVRLRPADLGTWLFVSELAAGLNDAATLTGAGAAVRQLEGPGGPTGRYIDGLLFAQQAAAGDAAAAAAGRALVQEMTRLDPGSPRPFILAAKLDDAEGKGDAATANLITAVGRGDRRPDLVRRAVQRLLKQGRYPDAFALIGTLDQEQLSPFLRRTAAELSLRLDEPTRAVDFAAKAAVTATATPDDLHWQAWVYLGAKRPAEAEAALREAIRRGGGPECRVTLVRVLVGRRPDPDAARLALQEVAALDAAATTPAGQLAAAEAHNCLGDTAAADARFRAAATAAPADATVLIAAANHFARTNRFPVAEGYYRPLAAGKVPAKPDEVAEARRALALGLAAGGVWARCQEALALLDANAKAAPADPFDEAARAAVLANTPGRRQEAVRWFEAHRARTLLTPAQCQTLARAYVTTGQWLKARQPLLQFLGDGTGVTANELADVVALYLRFDDTEGAAEWLRWLRKAEPNAARTAALAARLADKAGRHAAAVAELAALTPTADADRIAVAEAWEAVREFGRAEALLAGYAAGGAGKEKTRGLTLLHFYGRTGNPAKVAETCEHLLRDGVPADAVMVFALDALRGRTPDAAVYARIEAAMAAAPGGPPKWVDYILAAIREEQGDPAAAAKAADRFLAKYPDNEFGLLKRARLALLHDKDPAAALRLADTAIAKFGPAPQLIDVRAAALLASGQPDAAKTAWELAAADANDPVAHFRLARRALDGGNVKAAADLWKTALAAGLVEGDLHPIERPLMKVTADKVRTRP